MADDEINPLGTPTTNYGWIKPTVGGDDDAWGGLLNTDLDGIDSTVKSVSTVANAAYPASNPAGYITASAIPAPYVLPTASTTVLGGVKVDGSTITVNSGVISSLGGAVASATPPASSTPGMLWFDSVGGQTYVYYNDGNSSQWVIAVNAGASLQPASTTVLGAVKVDGTTIQAAADGTISAPIFMGDNRIINGDMRIDQRNNGAAGTANGYTVDRWQYLGAQANKGTWQQVHSAGATGFQYVLNFTSSSAYTLLAGDYFIIQQPIEADMVNDLVWGTPQAQPVTLSFWANASAAGTYSGSIRNTAGTRSYPFSFSAAANTWAKIVLTIPGDTGGTWVMNGNAAAFSLAFDLGSGATNRAPAGAWVSGSYVGANGASSIVTSNGAQFALTGVKLEIGSVATPYNRQSLAKSMADCQRYYQGLISIWISGYNSPGNGVGMTLGIAAMRANPTVNIGTPSYSNCSALSTPFINTSAIGLQAVVTATAAMSVSSNIALSAEL